MRVVVITGAGGKSFVSGADISKFESERASLDAIKQLQPDRRARQRDASTSFRSRPSR